MLALHKTLTIAYEREVSNYIKNNKIDKFLELNNLTIDELRHMNENLTFNEKLDWLFPSNWELSTLTLPFVPYGDIKKNLSTEDVLNDGISIMKNVFNSNFEGAIIFLLYFFTLYLVGNLEKNLYNRKIDFYLKKSIKTGCQAP